jgi:hypothetical protein
VDIIFRAARIYAFKIMSGVTLYAYNSQSAHAETRRAPSNSCMKHDDHDQRTSRGSTEARSGDGEGYKDTY